MDEHMSDHYNDEVFSRRVPAGKRTGEDTYQKHKLFLYKEDFGKFVDALHEAIDHIRTERLPEYDFSDVRQLQNGQG